MTTPWTFDRTDLVDAVHSVARVATRDQPWMSAAFEDGVLTLTGDNSMTQITVRARSGIPGDPFTVGLPSNLTNRIVKNMTGANVTVVREWDRVVFSDGTVEASARTPVIAPEFAQRSDQRVDGHVKRERFAAAVEAVIDAVDPDAASPYGGVRLQFLYGDYWVVASDGYRVHCVQLAGNLGFAAPVTVPALALTLAVDAVADPMIRLGTAEGAFLAYGSHTSVAANTIDAPFLDWHPLAKQPTPAETETCTVFDAATLRNIVAAARGTVLCDVVTLEMTPESNRVTTTGTSPDGTISTSMNAAVSGGASTVKFSTRYLLDALKHLGPEAVMTVPTKGGVHFRSANSWFRAIVSPQR